MPGLAALGLLLFTGAAGFGQSGDTNGTIEGVVTFEGEIPRSTVTDDAGMRHELVEVDAITRGLRHVVAYVTRSDGARLSSAGPARRPPAELLMDQVDYAFTPRVLAVQAGEPVTFKNSDPANHNVRASARNATNEFNVFTGVDGKYEHRFAAEPNYRPVRLGCDIHPWMAAWVFVFDHPFFSVTDERGRFRISVPPGDYELHLVQPAITHNERRKVRVTANASAKVQVVIQRQPAKAP